MTQLLIIEDEAPLREEIVEWLEYEGFEVLGAADGLQGVDLALQYHPDLVICDVMMPKLDGYGVLLELQSRPQTLHTPFIFVTAKATREDMRKGMALGADDYLTKPFSREELLDAIQVRLAKKTMIEGEYRQQIDDLRVTLTEERAQRLLKEYVVAMFSHDFRNPLTAIMAATTLMKNYSDRLTELQKSERLDRIEGSVCLLVQMLDDMLLTIQMENGQIKVNPETLSPQRLISDLVDEFILIYGKVRQFELHTNYPHFIQADKRLLRQMTVNLLSNAVKYSSNGTRIVITLRELPEGFFLQVSDEGIGIPNGDLQRLFEPYFRASNANRSNGTGLGLAIVKQAVDLHHGVVEVTSEEGRGTTFSIHIPTRNLESAILPEEG